MTHEEYKKSGMWSRIGPSTSSDRLDLVTRIRFPVTKFRTGNTWHATCF